MNIQYALESNLTSREFVDLLRRSSLAERRPIDEPATITGMLLRATMIVTARSQGKLVGVSRAISDRAYCTYLSDLAVDREYQRQGIGKQLIALTHQSAGLGTTLILLAAPLAASYYPHIDMQSHDSCWIIPRIPAAALDSPELASASSVAAEPLSDLGANVGQFFDKMATDYDQAIHRCFPRYSEMLWAVLEYLPESKTKNPKILELGCGTGNLSLALVERFPESEYTFVDISSQSLEQCRARLPGDLHAAWVCGDMRQADFAADSFDYVVSSIAIHHLTSSEKQELFANCLYWLRRDGVLCYSDQFAAATREQYDRHLSNWKRVSIQAGSSEEDWELWMEHQRLHDYHDSLPDQMEWLAAAGFDRIDCPWRYLLWTVVQARRPMQNGES